MDGAVPAGRSTWPSVFARSLPPDSQHCPAESETHRVHPGRVGEFRPSVKVPLETTEPSSLFPSSRCGASGANARGGFASAIECARNDMFQSRGRCLTWLGAAALLAAAIAAVSRPQDQTLTGRAAFGSWRDDTPGRKRLIRPEDLPAISSSIDAPAEIVSRPSNATPRVPDGFSAELVTTDIHAPRVIRTAPNGDLFVADSVNNTVHVLRIPPGTAKPSVHQVFAAGLFLPFGIAFYPPGPNPEWIYIANSNGLIRFPYKNGDLKPSGAAQNVLGGIPTFHHWARDIVFASDGSRLFFS